MAKQFQVDTDTSLTTDLLSYYKLEDGNDYYASNNLSVEGDTTFISGKVNNAANFPGTDDYLDGGDVLDFERTDSFSFAFWVKRSAISASMALICKVASDYSTPGYYFYFESGNRIRFILTNNLTNNYLMAVTGSNTSTDWQQIILTYDGSSTFAGIHIYVNNSNQDLTDEVHTLSATTLSASSFQIATKGLTHDYNGLIDELGIWGKVLSAQERTDLYNSGDGQTMVEPSGPANLKSYNGLAKASMKSIMGLAIEDVKSINGLE